MRHVWAVVFCLAILGTLAAAQDKPLAEITGAYQFNHLTLSGYGESGTLNLEDGFDASVNVPVTRWLGVVGDVGRTWKTRTVVLEVQPVSATVSLWTYGAGPQLTYRTPHVQPFARFIFGEAHSSAFTSLASVSAGASANSFFIAPGAGADFRIARDAWLRVGVDYFHTSKDGIAADGVRAFAGITLTFGGRKESPERDRAATKPSASAGMKIDVLGVMVAAGRSLGAEITDEAPNGVAAHAGLHVGDVINTVDDTKVKTPMELAAELSKRPAGESVRLGYLLHGEWQAETVVLLSH